MPFTEFCCRAGGSNLNAGSVDGSSTEPATTALAAYTGGDWNATTDVYTAPVGADMGEAVIGRYASLFHDGDTEPTINQYLLAKITAVDAGARTITLSTTNRTLMGTEVATGSANRSLRIGGAWAGPSGAVGFPMTFLHKNIAGTTDYVPRVNYKNDQVYAITATIAPVGLWATWHWGYSSTYEDGGYAEFNGGTVGASYTVINGNTSNQNYAYLHVINNGATGQTNAMIVASESVAFRVKVSGARGYGLVAGGSQGCALIECEVYGCNTANVLHMGGIGGNGSGVIVRCISRDNMGSNNAGFYLSGVGMTPVDCISYGNGFTGFSLASSAYAAAIGCTAYSNGQAGFFVVNGGDVWLHLENNVAVANGTYGVALNVASSGRHGMILNCAFGDNPSGNIHYNTVHGLVELGSITLGAGVRPWVDADAGDFRINHASLKNAGRGEYLQSDGGITVGYRDIGSAQHQDDGGGGSIVRVEPTYALGI